MKILFYIFLSSLILSCQSLKFAKKETQGERTPQSKARGLESLFENLNSLKSGLKSDLEKHAPTNQAKKGRSFESKKLQNINMEGKDLTKANFKNADLRGADLSSTNLSGADFRGANLTGAKLNHAILSGADFRGANLFKTQMRVADLSGAKMFMTNLTRTDFSMAFIPSKYRKNIMASGALNTDKINWVD